MCSNSQSSDYIYYVKCFLLINRERLQTAQEGQTAIAWSVQEGERRNDTLQRNVKDLGEKYLVKGAMYTCMLLVLNPLF